MFQFRLAAFGAAILISIITVVNCQMNANPTIPTHLLDCYRNSSIYYRGNRLPSTLRSFLDLIRKVEKSPTGRNMNAREMSIAVLYHLRLDGILPTPNVQATAEVIPFAPSGDEYYRHRLTLVGLLPKANQPSSYTFFNESLTTQEICNLHFMLSYSIDPYRRDNEQCSGISMETYSSHPGQNMKNGRRYRRQVLSKLEEESIKIEENRNKLEELGQKYENYNKYPKKWDPKDEKKDQIKMKKKKTIKKMGDEAEITLEYLRQAHKPISKRELRVMSEIQKEAKLAMGTLHLAPKSTEKRETLASMRKVIHEIDKINSTKKVKREVAPGESKEEEDKNSQVEVVKPPEPVQEQKSDNKKEQFTVGNQHMLGPGSGQPRRGGLVDNDDPVSPSPRTRPVPIPRMGVPGVEKRTAIPGSVVPKSILPGYDVSDCPIENGVVYTPYGSVTIGTVVAGIAAGLNRQYISPTQLNVDPTEIKPELANVKVDNVWATTVAGNTADMILSVGQIDDINQAVGLKGGWNDTFNQRWYLLQNKNYKYITDVELRGALDGLWLGQNVQDWASKYNTLKLSQILDMYYSDLGSVFDPNVQACKRRSNLVNYAPTDTCKQQVHIFSQVMNKQSVNTVTITDFTKLAENAVTNINNYVQQWSEMCDDNYRSQQSKALMLNSENAQMDQSCESSSRSSGLGTNDINLDNSDNVIIVVDSSWEYDSIQGVLNYLADREVVATPFQSNLTLLCGSSGLLLAVAEDKSGLTTNLTKDVYQTCTPGIDIEAVYSQLEAIYRKIYFDEQTINVINTLSQIVMFLPYTSSNLQNSARIQERHQFFQYTFPDVKFLAASVGGTDAYSSVVDDTSKDLFNIQIPTGSSSAESLNNVINRIKEIPQRVSKPQCGSYYEYQSGNSQTIDNIRNGYTKFYRLHPNYFYSVDDDAKITIKSIRASPLTVCYSRDDPQPRSGDSGGFSGGDTWNKQSTTTRNYNQITTQSPYSTSNSLYQNQHFNYFNNLGKGSRQSDGTDSQNCKTITGETYEIVLSKPCKDADSVQECKPLYISVTAPLQTPDNLQFTCLTCRYPTNVEYQIGVEGLSCDKGGVGTILFNPVIALISIIVILLTNKMF